MSKCFSILLCLFILTGCDDDHCINGHGSVVSETLYTPAFDAIKVDGSMNVFIKDGDEHIVEAIGHSNIIARLRLNEIGGALHIDLENDCYRDYELAIYITTPFIERVTLDGSGDIQISPMEMNNDLQLEVEGSGDINFNSLEGVGNLEVQIDGSGQIRGHESWAGLNNLQIEIEGSGDYRGFDVITENCGINIDGSGNCRVHVTDNLDVILDGSGDVFYKGNPNIDSGGQGSGNIIDSN